MKWLSLFVTIMFFSVFAGCGGGGDDDEDIIVVPPAGGSAEIVVKADTLTANSGVATNTGTINVSQAGTIRTVVTWTVAPPAQLVSFFKKSGPTNYAWATGASGFQGIEHIPAGGIGTYTFYISNSAGPTVSVSYIIYFTPD